MEHWDGNRMTTDISQVCVYCVIIFKWNYSALSYITHYQLFDYSFQEEINEFRERMVEEIIFSSANTVQDVKNKVLKIVAKPRK